MDLFFSLLAAMEGADNPSRIMSESVLCRLAEKALDTEVMCETESLQGWVHVFGAQNFQIPL